MPGWGGAHRGGGLIGGGGAAHGEIFNSDLLYKLGVEFLGQVDGGRWVVNLRGIDDEEDIAHLMIEGGLAKARVDRTIHENKIATIKDEKRVAPSVSITTNMDQVAETVSVGKTESIEDIVLTPTKAKPLTEPTQVKAASEPNKAKPAAEEAVPTGPKISCGVLPVNDMTVVGAFWRLQTSSLSVPPPALSSS